jgi:hypothetical protein
MRTDQIAELYFKSIKNSDQRVSKARARLLKLYRGKMVNRARYPGEAYIYFTQGKADNRKRQHYLAITDVLLQIMAHLPAGSRVDYDIEVKRGQVITDLLIRYRNEFRKEQRTYYVEVELDSSGDIENKIRAYEDIIEDGTLIVACKHRRTLERVKAGRWVIPVVACDTANIILSNVCLK